MLALIAIVAIVLHLPALADSVDDLVKSEWQKHQVPGLACLIIKKGQPARSICCGVANLEWNPPVTEETVFEIGSVTKQFTAACILLLAQEGKLSLDDKISRHLHDTPGSWSHITIRHLLSHTSGLTNYDRLDGFELRLHLTQEKFIQNLGRFPLDFPPGAKWSYCNSGYNLLGYIVENVSGTNYWDTLRDRIFQPLQMTNTTRRDPDAVIPHRAAGYEFRNHLPVNRNYDLTDLFSAGAIVSTVADLAKWNAALEGSALLTEASKTEMWSAARLNDGKPLDYGLGWRLGSVEGHRNIGHSGTTSGFSASLQRFPDDGLSVILLSNTDELNFATTLAQKVGALCLSTRGASH